MRVMGAFTKIRSDVSLFAFRARRDGSFFMEKYTSDICFELIPRYLGTSPYSRICLSEVWPDRYLKSLVIEVNLQNMAVPRKKIRA